MGMRRLTRLTNGFSKKWDNLWSAYCVWLAYYNFCRIHQFLRITPAMAAGIATEPCAVMRGLNLANCNIPAMTPLPEVSRAGPVAGADRESVGSCQNS